MNGLYISGMGMISGQNHINAHANNLSNVNTDGYKFDSMVSKVFENKHGYRSDDKREFIGEYANKVNEEGTYIDLTQGKLEVSDNALQLTLNDGTKNEASFFVVMAENKQYLTRNGDFEVNKDGFLRTRTGEYVLDANGKEIIIPSGAQVIVNKDGKVQDSKTGNEVAQLLIKKIDVETRSALEKEANALFSFNGAGGIAGLPNSDVEVSSFMKEKSNVEMTDEMVKMMNAQRKFQASQKAFSAFDKIYEKEANNLIK